MDIIVFRLTLARSDGCCLPSLFPAHPRLLFGPLLFPVHALCRPRFTFGGNNRRMKQLGNRSPIEVMTGRAMWVDVRWRGWDKAHDTAEFLDELIKDVPEMVREYLFEHGDDEACQRELHRLGFL